MTAAERAEAEALPQDEAPRAYRRKRPAIWIISAVAVAGLCGGAVWAVADRSGKPAVTAGKPRESTGTVTRQTLVNSKQVDGTLGYAGSTTVDAQLAGTVTGLPSLNATVSRGHPLYSVDGTPVILMYGSSPAYREMRSGDKGQDVRQLESNLQALGYDGFTVDDTYSDATARAVERWQKSLGLPKSRQTGTVPLGRILFASGNLRIGEYKTQAGSTLTPGMPVLVGTSDKRQVHVDLDIGYQSLAKKDEKVTVSLPVGRAVTGTITSVGTVVTVTPGANGSPDKSTIGIDIALKSGDAGAYTQAPVTVSLRSAEEKNVLTVPVTALLALSEGGYGVEVIGSDGRSTVVAVTLGMFADGRVQVSGSALKAGAKVGVAQ